MRDKNEQPTQISDFGIFNHNIVRRPELPCGGQPIHCINKQTNKLWFTELRPASSASHAEPKQVRLCQKTTRPLYVSLGVTRNLCSGGIPEDYSTWIYIWDYSTWGTWCHSSFELSGLFNLRMNNPKFSTAIPWNYPAKRGKPRWIKFPIPGENWGSATFAYH